MRKYIVEKECAICRKKFVSYHPNTKYCSEGCKTEGNRLINASYEIRQKEKALEKKKHATALADVAVEARKAGMTYGRYVAMMNL